MLLESSRVECPSALIARGMAAVLTPSELCDVARLGRPEHHLALKLKDSALSGHTELASPHLP